MKLILGMLLGALAQTLSFIQLQGKYKWEWLGEHTFLLACFGVPVAYLYMLSVDYIREAFNGENWPGRIIGFGIGVVVFSVMSWILFNESINTKTTVSLGLAVAIICVQVFWK